MTCNDLCLLFDSVFPEQGVKNVRGRYYADGLNTPLSPSNDFTSTGHTRSRIKMVRTKVHSHLIRSVEKST